MVGHELPTLCLFHELKCAILLDVFDLQLFQRGCHLRFGRAGEFVRRKIICVARSFDRAHEVTRQERFLAEMDAVVPWARLVALIAPYYPKQNAPGRPALGLEKMLRIYFPQQWFNLSDPQSEDALRQRVDAALRPHRLGHDIVPDETTILRCRHLLECHGLTVAIF